MSDPDPDQNALSVVYSLTGNAGGRFKIDPGSGEVVVANGALLDSCVASSHSITILGTRSDGQTATVSTTVAVTARWGLQPIANDIFPKQNATESPTEVFLTAKSRCWVRPTELDDLLNFNGIRLEIGPHKLTLNTTADYVSSDFFTNGLGDFDVTRRLVPVINCHACMQTTNNKIFWTSTTSQGTTTYDATFTASRIVMFESRLHVAEPVAIKYSDDRISAAHETTCNRNYDFQSGLGPLVNYSSVQVETTKGEMFSLYTQRLYVSDISVQVVHCENKPRLFA